MNAPPSTGTRNPQLWLLIGLAALACGAGAWVVVALLAREVLG